MNNATTFFFCEQVIKKMHEASLWISEKLLFKPHCWRLILLHLSAPTGEQHDRFSASHRRVALITVHMLSLTDTRRGDPLFQSPTVSCTIRISAYSITMKIFDLGHYMHENCFSLVARREGEPVCLTLMHADNTQ